MKPSPSIALVPDYVSAPIDKEQRRRLDRERRARRRRIEAMVRPAPGTSELLSRPLSVEVRGVGGRDVEIHDLTAMAPMHLLRR